MSFSRRSFLMAGAAAGAVGISGYPGTALGRGGSDSDGSTTTKSGLVFGYTPFTQPLFIPDVLTPLGSDNALDPTPAAVSDSGPKMPRGICNDVAHGIAPEYGQFFGQQHKKEYLLVTEETTQRFVPGGPDTPVFTYRDGTKAAGSGRTPGPTVVANFDESVVLRNCNLLTRDRSGTNSTDHDHETSLHLHGTHAPAHADGYPDFYVLAGEGRDYFYPNQAPRMTDPGTNTAPRFEGPFDETWIPSTVWYHDHGMDVTGFNVTRGLAGFYLMFDEREKHLIGTKVLPNPFELDAHGNPLDIGLALQDQRFNADGTIHYDFLDHNGRIGDVFTVNGRVQPYLKVQPRKYRFRILNASNARVYRLRLSTRQPFLVIGADSWLFPRAGVIRDFEISSGQRHDVIIDFSGTSGEVFLENIMIQEDGRKGKEVDPDRPTPLLKFIVEGNTVDDITAEDETVIRGFAGIDPGGQWAPIREDEIVNNEFFRWDRSNGAWTVNNRFFNPRRADAVPVLGHGAERWVHENSSGGWWHPIHNHLEGFQIKTLDGKPPPFERSFNSDLVNLHGGEVAETFIKFRTFTGPFVFHCHNIEHEDMRMMGVHDPQPDGITPLDGVSEIDANISGVVPTCEQLEADKRIYFDEAGDVDRIEDRGVGFPDCEFDMDGRGNG